MKTFEDAMAAPDLAVIDAAIEWVRLRGEAGRVPFACYALQWAVLAEYPHLRVSAQQLILRRYQEQFTRHAAGRLKRPWWWSSCGAGAEPGIRALEAFRQACIEEAK